LCRLFYHEVIKPILETEFPELSYAAALIGPGSEVLGFDTQMSTDHHWGPRMMLFLTDDDLPRYEQSIHDIITHNLPYTFRGYPTNFTPPDPNDNGTQLLQRIDSGPINHRVETLSLRAYCLEYLGIEPDVDLDPIDWLTIPGQKLRSVTAGAVYHDDFGELTDLRQRVAEYPHDIWLYMLASCWTRIGQEEPFMARAGIAGDELGSRLITARLVHDMMSLGFLMEKQYQPYSKWFGTAFSDLNCSEVLSPHLNAVLQVEGWQARQKHLTHALEIVARMHNDLSITLPLPAQVSGFHTRPIKVIHGEVFAKAIKAEIRDPEVMRISRLTDIGAVEQFSDSTNVLSDKEVCRKLGHVYE
jgi:hypothetical protein